MARILICDDETAKGHYLNAFGVAVDLAMSIKDPARNVVYDFGIDGDTIRNFLGMQVYNVMVVNVDYLRRNDIELRYLLDYPGCGEATVLAVTDDPENLARNRSEIVRDGASTVIFRDDTQTLLGRIDMRLHYLDANYNFGASTDMDEPQEPPSPGGNGGVTSPVVTPPTPRAPGDAIARPAAPIEIVVAHRELAGAGRGGARRGAVASNSRNLTL